MMTAQLQCDGRTSIGLLRVSTAEGHCGPLIVLSGEADITTAADLASVIDALLALSTRRLTVDMSGLSFADACSLRVLTRAASTLRDRGGELVLLDPREVVTRALVLLGMDEMLTIQGESRAGMIRGHDCGPGSEPS